MRTKVALLILLMTTFISITSITAQEDLITLDINDILERIAASFDISVDCLGETNNLDSFDGTLTVDSSCPPYEGELATATTAEEFGQGGAIQTYTVQRGDRLADIAEEFDTTVSCIQSANSITDPNLIFPGQDLLITETCSADATIEPTTTTATTSAGTGGGATNVTATGECLGDRNAGRSTQGNIYEVQPGDILDFIACDFDVSLACIVESNASLQDRRDPTIRIGQLIRIDTEECGGYEGPFYSGRLNANP